MARFVFSKGGALVEEASAFKKHGFSRVRGPLGMPLITGGGPGGGGGGRGDESRVDSRV